MRAESVNVIWEDPRFRNTLRGLNDERIDDLVFPQIQPRSSDVMGWVMAYLGQSPGFENLQLQLWYAENDRDRVMAGGFDAVSKVAENSDCPYIRLNWAASVRDSGGSAIFMLRSGREPCELQVITAAQKPTVDPSGLLNYVAQQYETYIHTSS